MQTLIIGGCILVGTVTALGVGYWIGVRVAWWRPAVLTPTQTLLVGFSCMFYGEAIHRGAVFIFGNRISSHFFVLLFAVVCIPLVMRIAKVAFPAGILEGRKRDKVMWERVHGTSEVGKGGV